MGAASVKPLDEGLDTRGASSVKRPWNARRTGLDEVEGRGACAVASWQRELNVCVERVRFVPIQTFLIAHTRNSEKDRAVVHTCEPATLLRPGQDIQEVCRSRHLTNLRSDVTKSL